MNLHPAFYARPPRHTVGLSSSTRHALMLMRRAEWYDGKCNHLHQYLVQNWMNDYRLAIEYSQNLDTVWRTYSWAQEQGIVLG